ncbi:MAG: hypothetical protein PHG00_17590 [Methylococcales bacterium]|nr:hypothetical protein [Methylococcales bacterium]
MEKLVSSFSFIAWKQRLVFWIDAIIVGQVIVMMTLLSEWTAQIYRTPSLQFPRFLLLSRLSEWGVQPGSPFVSFGSERSGIPQVETAKRDNFLS